MKDNIMVFNKPTLITITAPTCSGKTYLVEHLEKLGMNRIVGFTTRAPRAGEVHGVDYYFITHEEADNLEAAGLLAETAEFRGNRYGVTHDEMENKVSRSNMPPVIILEPQGLESYIDYCLDKGWDIFKVFVTVTEKVRIDRLNARTAQDIKLAVANGLLSNTTGAQSAISLIETHTGRLMSITGDERTWLAKHRWDAIVPGDNIIKAISMIEQGVKCRNTKNAAVTQNSPKGGPSTFAPDLQHRVLTSFMRGT
jgi:guanylate kinase